MHAIFTCLYTQARQVNRNARIRREIETVGLQKDAPEGWRSLSSIQTVYQKAFGPDGRNFMILDNIVNKFSRTFREQSSILAGPFAF